MDTGPRSGPRGLRWPPRPFGRPIVARRQELSGMKDRLIAPMFLAIATAAMTLWLGLIGYGAWHFLFG